MTTVADVMSRKVQTVDPDMTLPDLERLLDRERLSGAPVVAADGEVLGVVSRADVVRALLQEREGLAALVDFYQDAFDVTLRARPLVAWEGEETAARLDTLPVREVMSARVVSVEPGEAVETAGRKMLAERVHRVLVTQGHRLVGIVSSLDLIRWAIERE